MKQSRGPERTPVKVIRAEEMGMCFGVRDALAAARSLADPGSVTIHGELVHNAEVLLDLGRRGFHSTPEGDRARVPATPRVLITAHGVSRRERERLRAAGKEVLDTTCPLVRFVHATALALQAEGEFVVVIGRHGHVEVEGIVGDLDRHAVLERVDEAVPYPAERIAVICQTTTPPERARALFASIVSANPGREVRFVDTICGPTRNRQDAASKLLAAVDAVVVVGGRNSNNTRELVRLADAHAVPVVHVRSSADLDPAWVRRYRTVGLTAGTSTLDETIDEVHTALLALAENYTEEGGRDDRDEGEPVALDCDAARIGM